MAKKKKKKRSAAEMHRQIQDSLQALPYALEEHQKQGRRGKAALLRWVGGPILRLINRILNRQRYRGPEGTKLKQAEQMKRHLEQRKQAYRHLQGEMQKAQKQARKGKPR